MSATTERNPNQKTDPGNSRGRVNHRQRQHQPGGRSLERRERTLDELCPYAITSTANRQRLTYLPKTDHGAAWMRDKLMDQDHPQNQQNKF